MGSVKSSIYGSPCGSSPPTKILMSALQVVHVCSRLMIPQNLSTQSSLGYIQQTMCIYTHTHCAADKYTSNNAYIHAHQLCCWHHASSPSKLGGAGWGILPRATCRGTLRRSLRIFPMASKNAVLKKERTGDGRGGANSCACKLLHVVSPLRAQARGK